MKRSRIEFLLVRTGNGRWTFPKGCVEPGMTGAQSAAMEAFEEAGVHGRIEEQSFARYFYRKRRSSRRASGREELVVHAHLCEVSKLGRPQESKRTPKWFPAEKAKSRLRERRSEDESAELARVIDLAVAHTRRSCVRSYCFVDPLRKVKFDLFDIACTPHTLQQAMRNYIRREQNTTDTARLPLIPAQRLLTGKVLLKAKKAF